MQVDLMVLLLAHDFLVELFWLCVATKWKLPTWKRTERLPLIDYEGDDEAAVCLAGKPQRTQDHTAS